MFQPKRLTLLPLIISHAIAQSQAPIATSLVFAPWDEYLSVISANATATTYLQDNSDPSRNNTNTQECDAEAYDRITIVNGPSTAGATYIYTSCGTNVAMSYHYDCPLTEPNTATCTYVASSGNVTVTSSVTQNSSELSPQPCLITAGIQKLTASVTASTTSASSTGRSSSTQPTPSPQTTSLQPTANTTANSAANSATSSAAATNIPAPVGKVLVAVAGAFLAGF